MPTFTNWNLDVPLADLRNVRNAKHRENIECDFTRCRDLVDGKPDTAYELVHCFHSILQLDARLFAWHSAITLIRLVGGQWAYKSESHDWLSSQCDQLATLIDDFAAWLSQCVAPLPANIQQWLNSLDTGAESELQQGYEGITKRWKTNEPNIHSALASRSSIDPQCIAFRQRLTSNRLVARETALSDLHLEESRRYFESILDRTGHASATLENVRALEASSFADIGLTLSEAIDLLLNSLASLEPICRNEVEALLSEARLRLAEPDLCLDTPYGSYVQLRFDGGLETAVRLAHEVGHAVHQRLHRESTVSFLPLTDVDSETWAMAFENRFLNTLESRKPQWTSAIQAFRRYQLIEMNHRHRMLHDFEQALHGPSIQTEADINRLWLRINNRFYGDRVVLEPGFESAWTDVHHLFTAPFYLSVYGVAKERADRCDLSSMIHTYVQEKETAQPCFR